MAENNIKKITAKELLEKNVVDFDKEKTSKRFYHYTTVSTAKKILQGKEEHYFYLNPISSMNDINEAEMHGTDSKRVFALCFCGSDYENIPLWYLYAGITGEGARISLTKDKMHKFIKSITQVRPVVDGKLGPPLAVKENFTVKCRWVFYRDSDKKIWCNHATYSIKGSSKEFNRKNYFVKDYTWKYEKEFRILVELCPSVDVPPQIAIPFDKRSLAQGLSVTLAPEAKNNPDAISQFAHDADISKSKVKPSKLNIKMEVLKRNSRSIYDHFSDVLEGMKRENLGVGKLCEVMKGESLCADTLQEMLVGSK